MPSLTIVRCSQCGTEATGDPTTLEDWLHGALVAAGELDDDAAADLLLCPDCVAEERDGVFETGGEAA
jgi:hypothetical protein